jgi:hypothetical protein
VDKDRPIDRVSHHGHSARGHCRQRRFVLILFEAFGLAALLLAAIGIYGILVRQRDGAHPRNRRARGPRCNPRDILALVLRQGMTMTRIGLVIGLCAALAAGRALDAMLFGVSWLDGLTYLGATLLLFARIRHCLPHPRPPRRFHRSHGSIAQRVTTDCTTRQCGCPRYRFSEPVQKLGFANFEPATNAPCPIHSRFLRMGGRPTRCATSTGPL